MSHHSFIRVEAAGSQFCKIPKQNVSHSWYYFMYHNKKSKYKYKSRNLFPFNIISKVSRRDSYRWAISKVLNKIEHFCPLNGKKGSKYISESASMICNQISVSEVIAFYTLRCFYRIVKCILMNKTLLWFSFSIPPRSRNAILN